MKASTEPAGSSCSESPEPSGFAGSSRSNLTYLPPAWDDCTYMILVDEQHAHRLRTELHRHLHVGRRGGVVDVAGARHLAAGATHRELDVRVLRLGDAVLEARDELVGVDLPAVVVLLGFLGGLGRVRTGRVLGRRAAGRSGGGVVRGVRLAATAGRERGSERERGQAAGQPTEGGTRRAHENSRDGWTVGRKPNPATQAARPERWRTRRPGRAGHGRPACRPAAARPGRSAPPGAGSAAGPAAARCRRARTTRRRVTSLPNEPPTRAVSTVDSRMNRPVV